MRKFFLIITVLMMISGLSLAQDEELSPYEIALQRIYEIALERIKEAKRTDAISLDLSNLGLETLPPEIGKLSNLVELNLHWQYPKIMECAVVSSCQANRRFIS